MKRFNIHKKANSLRKRGTKWEQIVRVALTRHKIAFKFQYVYTPYIVDFVLPDRGVILEIERAIDEQRTTHLEQSTGYRVIRWRNIDVTTNLPTLIRSL